MENSDRRPYGQILAILLIFYGSFQLLVAAFFRRTLVGHLRRICLLRCAENSDRICFLRDTAFNTAHPLPRRVWFAEKNRMGARGGITDEYGRDFDELHVAPAAFTTSAEYKPRDRYGSCGRNNYLIISVRGLVRYHARCLAEGICLVDGRSGR